MKTISTSLVHKVISPRRQSGGASPAILFLHGRGADEEDLLGLSEYFDDRFLFVSARAPFPFAFGGGFTWYDLVEIGRPEPAMFAESYKKLMAFIGEIRAGYPVDPGRLFLCGFSMGTVMSYSAALTQPALIAGVMANSGYIPEGTALGLLWNEIGGKPFFVSHGRFDPVIPVSYAQRARELLNGAKAQVSYHEFDMAHQIGEEGLGEMITWVSHQLEKK